MTYEQLLDFHKLLFDSILGCIWRTIQEHPVLRSKLRVSQKGYWVALSKAISRSLEANHKAYRFEYEDVKQQLLLTWLWAFRKSKAPSLGHLKKELMRFSLFQMRNWVKRQTRSSRVGTEPLMAAQPRTKLKLDLNFVLNGTDLEPYCYLSKRDRLELYLHYNNDITITDMVDIVRYRKQNVIDHLKDIHEFLRSNNADQA